MKRLVTIAVVVLLLLVAAAVATYARYQSFSPCDWMEHDLVARTGQPLLVAQASIRASFLMQGIVDPSPQQCLVEWWRQRRNGAEADS
jgi:hypothetical protein